MLSSSKWRESAYYTDLCFRKRTSWPTWLAKLRTESQLQNLQAGLSTNLVVAHLGVHLYPLQRDICCDGLYYAHTATRFAGAIYRGLFRPFGALLDALWMSKTEAPVEKYDPSRTSWYFESMSLSRIISLLVHYFWERMTAYLFSMCEGKFPELVCTLLSGTLQELGL